LIDGREDLLLSKPNNKRIISEAIHYMTNIVFICHGNICRSPMAEIIMKHLVKEAGLEDKYHIESRATSYEEYGNPIYPPARREIQAHGLKVDETKQATVFDKKEYGEYDYLILMDGNNVRNLMRIIGGDPDNKVYKLLEFTGSDGDIEDPWYSRNFHKVWEQIYEGCEALLKHIEKW